MLIWLNVVMGFSITCSKQCSSLRQIPRQFRVSCIAFGRCVRVVGRVRACYFESREMPGITCFSHPMLSIRSTARRILDFPYRCQCHPIRGSQREVTAKAVPRSMQAAIYMNSCIGRFFHLDFPEIWNVFPNEDVGHAITVFRM